jgi:phenylalanyl-tRNA synthetase alpha chain
MNIIQLIEQLNNSSNLQELELAYEDSLGKKWRLTEQYSTLKNLSPDEKKSVWSELAIAKQKLTEIYDKKLSIFKAAQINAQLEQDIVDITTPTPYEHKWSYSLLTSTRRKIEEICQNMWFTIEYGHDMVTKFENFISLNIPLTHPATEMHDTFFLTDRDETGENYVLRTHTTAIDNDLIKHYWVPCKIAIPSKVYRYEATDASHDTTFYQLEGTYIDKWVSIAHFKDFIQKILSAIFEKDVTVRMRPGYFPFVEPGFEIDASCPICNGNGCSLCKKTGWIEIMWAGMLHPEVLRQAGVDPKEYSGYAFGMGINRLVAVKYRIKDIRLFTNGDLRFSRSFTQ